MQVNATPQNYKKLLSIYIKYSDVLYPNTIIEEQDKIKKIQKLFEPIQTDNKEFLKDVEWACRDGLISEHALQRFKERYDIELDDDFYDIALKGIKQTSINKKGHVVNNSNRGIYRCIYKNVIVEYVLSKQKNGIVICTFNTPPKTISDICYSYKKEK